MDELPDVVSVRRFKEFGGQQKEELYETLLNLSLAVKDIPKKSLRKTLDLTFAVLAYKGEQVSSLEKKISEKSQQDSQDEYQQERLLDENDKLKQMLEKLEDEKSELKQKNKDLTDELLQQQKRLQDALNTAELSDKDSSDPLSELEKQEELLRNIARKNKHIKRLLKEIETLQSQNIEQSKRIIQLEKDLQCERNQIVELKNEILEIKSNRKSLKATINDLNTEIIRLEGNLTYLEEERENSERDLKDFIEKLEIKAQSWKNLLDEKETELTEMRTQIVEDKSNNFPVKDKKCTDIEPANETTKLMSCLELRDQQIEKLESKLKAMAEEMISTTQLMNKLSIEREHEQNPKNPRACCKVLEQSLQATNKRCCELSEMLERSEEDNAIKSKQAIQAISALETYQRGEDGLIKAIKKCSALEQKISARDKQIRALVTQLNSMHEIANENTILRKRLNIPDDVVISTKNLAAKERNKEKVIDRLSLKLRASEEMRLQLKLEKNELRKQITSLQLKLQQEKETDVVIDRITERHEVSGEIGEITESLQTTEITVEGDFKTCPQCHYNSKANNFERIYDIATKPMLADLQAKYHEVLEENDTLRLGMHEILDKLRDYNATSEHITIDSEILYRLLQALQATSAPHTPKRLHLEVRSLQAREEALRALLSSQAEGNNESTETDELPSVDSMRQNSFDKIEKISLPNSPALKTIQSDNSSQNGIKCTVSNIQQSQQSLQHLRTQQQEIDEMTIYRERYEQLQLHFATSDVESHRSCVAFNAEITDLKIELGKLKNAYQFMREDFDRTLTELQKKELECIETVANFKTEINSKELEINRIQNELNRFQLSIIYSADEYENLLKAKNDIQAQLAFIVERIFSGHLSTELKIKDICSDYGIIDNNFQLNYIAVDEYKQQKDELNNAEQKKNDLERKTMQLEQLLEIAQDQIQSQQRLLNEITDNHIDLRYLVADLQSHNEEKHLMAKMQRELNGAKTRLTDLEHQNEQLNQKYLSLKAELAIEKERNVHLTNSYENERCRKDIKIKFLLKSMQMLKEKYAKFTPLIFLTNFVFAYTRYSKREQTTMSSQVDSKDVTTTEIQEIVNAKLNERSEQMTSDDALNLIKLIKAETQCKSLKENLEKIKKKCENLQQELTEQCVRFATESEHWHTIEVLCADERNPNATNSNEEKQCQTKATNTDTDSVPVSTVECIDKSLSPILSPVKCVAENSRIEAATQTTMNANNSESVAQSVNTTRHEQLSREKAKTAEVMIQTVTQSVQTQAVQTVDSEDNTAVGIEPKNQDDSQKIDNKTVYNIQEQLLLANKRIQELQQLLETKKSQHSETKSNVETDRENGIIEKTIMSFNALLMDKDKSIGKYQDLLQSEREQNNSLAAKLHAEVEDLKSTVTNLNFNIKAKDIEIMDLKTKLESISKRRNSNEKLDLALAVGTDDNVDNSLHELSDEKIEEMFDKDTTTTTTTTSQTVKENTQTLQQQNLDLNLTSNQQHKITDLDEKLKYAESTIKIKEEEMSLLKEKLKLCLEREKSLGNTQNPELEKLRLMIEEKDKHITDLMDTLKSFHDDQQNFIKDSSSYSQTQITKLSADLMRIEATNKIYQTQVEALRRQVTSLTQREKQARELNQSLRNQLIKRPVVSIKTELNTRVKTESMQKRIQQLELDLEEARAQIQRQQIVIETKRAKSASEVGLWEKQKRWQQNAEKFKAKLEETEITLEKTRALLQSARNTITRLEKDKQILEVKLGRATAGASSVHQCGKYCQTSSCPNTTRTVRSNVVAGKYTPSESPETYTGASSEYSSPSQSVCDGNGSDGRAHTQRAETHHGNLIEALKARIELQQRKILAMQLEGKGTNALACEMEKLQEKLSSIEAQNIRLEAKNLQLQLDNDLLQQNDVMDRMQKRIKHLEDYIIALKEELAQTEARRVVCKCSGIKFSTQHQQSADQTILSLRNLVEKLRAENKYLKDGRRSTETRNSADAMPTDVNRLQQMYAEALDKIASLQLEINLKTKCSKCGSHGKTTNDTPKMGNNEELKFIKEQLLKKTQLLQKAKVLLTRAAAKEKVLKDQLALWKRKCSELQNVPVIDEISE